jgi:hypothetical protein
MLQYKNTINISELKKYFSSDEKAIKTLLREIRSLKISDKLFPAIDKCNTQYVGKHIFTILLLFTLFNVKFISDYNQSAIYQKYKCGKDVFYEFLNSTVFDWRSFAYKINRHLIKRVAKHSYNTDSK